MSITAYPLSSQCAILRPAGAAREWASERESLQADPALRRANALGWDLCCPRAFSATWNGGPAAEDIEIRFEQPGEGAPFVQSQQGAGVLTFHAGYQMLTAPRQLLWVRAPVNRPTDGLYPLESLVDASLLPATIVLHWQFTRPQHTVHFAAGEPFCTIVLQVAPDQDQEGLAIVPVLADPDESARTFQELLQDPAMQEVVGRLSATATPATPGASHQAPDPHRVAPSAWATGLTDPPPVSCICPTFGRVDLVEEALHAFLLQDYPGPKELIILNDYDRQTLVFDHPEVRVINVPGRSHSVGEKYKAAVALASHDLIAVWHDDDISLPHRLSYAVAHYRARHGFFKADRAWYWNEGQVSGPEANVFHGGSCWSRALFLEAGGYPHLDNGYDLGFELRCDEARPGATAAHRVNTEDIYYLYRWTGTGSYHLSAFGSTGQEAAQVVAQVRRQAEQGQIRLGAIRLEPHWQSDYVGLIHQAAQGAPTTPREDEIPFPPPFFVIPPPAPLAAEAAALFRRSHPASISVILPALNESVLLRRTVEQFEATLPEDGEIVVVDNGSTDGSADFLRESQHRRSILIHSPRPLGVAGARNRGLQEARGEVIVFADAHIDVPARWWQPIVATLNRPHVGVVGPAIGVMGKPEYPAACGQRIAEMNLRLEWLPRQQEEPHPVPTLGGGFMAVRRETLEQAGGFDDGMPQWGSEDLELCMRYWLLGYEVWVVPEVTVLHYFRSTNPLRLRPGIVTHNQLRVALLHFTPTRLARVTTALQRAADFGEALAQAVDSDVWQRRATLAARRVRDDDWFFQRFHALCPL